MRERVVTVWQPWASLEIAGIKDVENKPGPVPSTLPKWMKCDTCGARDQNPYRPTWSQCEPRGADHGWRRADGPFPFRLWIHAGQSLAREEFGDQLIREEDGTWYLDGMDDGPDLFLPRGELLGHVTVVNCHDWRDCMEKRGPCDCAGPDVGVGVVHEPRCGEPQPCSRWAQRGSWHWVLTHPVALSQPIPMRGMQGLPFLPDDVRDRALAQLQEAA